jgi:hypothetical protein
MRAGAQMWEAGYQALAEGWRQSQEFWNGVARSWGEAAGVWLGQLQGGRPQESVAMLRELQEAAFAVGQAWMRLPMILASGAQPMELQQAITRLTDAQGRAYQMWMETLSRASGGAGARPAAGGDKRG